MTCSFIARHIMSDFHSFSMSAAVDAQCLYLLIHRGLQNDDFNSIFFSTIGWDIIIKWHFPSSSICLPNGILPIGKRGEMPHFVVVVICQFLRLWIVSLLSSEGNQWVFLKYHYQFMDLNIFDRFECIAMSIHIDTKIFPSSARRNTWSELLNPLASLW